MFIFSVFALHTLFVGSVLPIVMCVSLTLATLVGIWGVEVRNVRSWIKGTADSGLLCTEELTRGKLGVKVTRVTSLSLALVVTLLALKYISKKYTHCSRYKGVKWII